MMEADPSRTPCSCGKRVEQRPIGDRIGSILHCLRLAIGTGDRAAIQMVSTNDNGGTQFPVPHHLIKRQSRHMALTQSKPANTGRESLKGDSFSGEVKPAMQRAMMGEQLLNLGIGFVDVLWIARERHPSKRTLAFAKEGSDAGGHETGKVKGVRDALVLGNLANVIAVINRRHAHLVKIKHRLHVGGTRSCGIPDEFGSILFRALPRGLPLFDCPSGRKVAIDQVMG